MKKINVPFFICHLIPAKQLFTVLFFIVSIVTFSQGTWTQKADFAGGKRLSAVAFSIANKGYIATGVSNGLAAPYFKDLWEWDQSNDTWTQKANFPDTSRMYAVGFSIGNKGYVGTGINLNIGKIYNDFWEYNPALNSWSQKANYPGAVRGGSTVFAIGSKGYLALGGVHPSYYNDLWEYDAVTDTWAQKANFPLIGRAFGIGFSIGNKGYVGTGSNWNAAFNDFWEYDPALNAWTQKANLPGLTRDDATGFAIGNYGYVGLGDSINFQTNKYFPLGDFWQYNPISNSWIQMANYGGLPVARASAFVIGCRGYVGLGWTGPANFTGATDDFWEFIPPIPSAAVAGVNTFCAGDSTSLFASGGLFYQWSTGETTNIIDVKPSTTTTYSVIVSDACGADTAAITVTVIPYPVISVSFEPNLCGSGVVQFTDSTLYGSTWYWNFGDGGTSSQQSPAHVYAATGQHIVTLTVTPSPFGCNSSAQFTVDVPPFSELYIPNAFSPNDDGNNDTYFISGSCIDEMHLSIFNRWGEKVFETSDQTQSWDGTYKGEKQNAGVYMYSFKGTLSTGEVIDKKGNITLMR